MDTFIKQQKNSLVFLQGHPRMNPIAAARYRRDVGRYVKGEASRYPLMPEVIDEATAEELTAFQQKAVLGGVRSCCLSSPPSSEIRKSRTHGKRVRGVTEIG